MCFLSEIVLPVVTNILERFIDPIQRQIGYLVQYNGNIQTLMGHASDLEAVKNDLLRLVSDAQEKGEEIKDEVLNWHAQAVQIGLDVELLEEKIQKSQGCCHAWCLDWRSRHQLSRKATKKTLDIDAHIPKGKFEDGVSFPARPATLTSLPTPDFVELETSMRALNEIMEFLKDEKNNISIIGVHGAGGIGKSELMKQVVKHAVGGKLFGKVVLVRVTETPNLRLIQNTIAKILGFDLEGDVEDLRRATLSKRLKERRKVLIILDDLWERLDLAEVGIPYGKDHEGCKVIVTSRSEVVCNYMEANRIVKIKELSQRDALILFKIKANIPDSPAFDRAAEEVVRQCGNLPNSIAVVGRALRHKDPKEWNEAIENARKFYTINIKGIPEEVVLCVSLGYDQLELPAKGFLEFSCLFPAYYSVSMEEFAIYGLVDKLFPDDGMLWQVSNKTRSFVTDLKSSNLLLQGDGEASFRVHDDTRKVVKFIASQRGNNLVAEAGIRKGWPEGDLESCTRLSLMDCNLTKLPDQPQCPQLLTMFLQNNALEAIPLGFFENMRAITFLDLSYTNISTLPLSVQCLGELRSLRLDSTRLRDASSMTGLDKLEVLILRGSCIEQLPKGLKKLTNLKLLDLSNNLFLQDIPANAISKLSRLEELYIGNSYGDWEVEGEGKENKAQFSEVASLANLTALNIHVKNTKSLAVEVDSPSWGNINKFRVCANDDYWDITSTKSMHLKNLSHPLANWVKLLLEKTEHLTLTRAKDLEDIMQKDVRGLVGLKYLYLRACSIDQIFRSSSFPRVENLEELHVEYCYSLKQVFELEEITDESCKLTRLSKLVLVGLPKLTTIWKGNHSIAHVENLTLMKVKDCTKMRNLFSKTLAQKLHQLEQLTILNCDNMEEIISNDQAEMDQEADSHAMNIPSMPVPRFFQNLQKLIISKCKKMECVFPLTIVQGLQQLEELIVVSCNRMREIIAIKDEEKEAADQNMLPQLKFLTLQDMPCLNSLYSGEMLVKLQSLEELQLWDCPELKKLPLAPGYPPKLKKFKVQSAWFESLKCEDDYTKMRLQRVLVEEE